VEEDLYDTSKLIDAYREGEILYGYTTILNLIEFPKAIDFNLRVLFPSKSDYNLALIISTELIKLGKPIPAIDSVIAAVALNNGLRVVTRDKHFLFVKEVKGDFRVEEIE
jgi:hypothetical protein